MITIDFCPICNDAAPVTITDIGDKFSKEKVMLCTNCGLGFLSPRMDDIELKEYYLSDSFSEDFRGSKTRQGDTRQELFDNASRRWGVVESFMFGDNLLEIGCSSGEFLALANASQRFNVFGIDPSSGYINSIDFGTTHVGAFPEYDFSDLVDKFDVICTFHTLEHVSDPQKFLDAIYDRLSDDGVFIMEYPDLSLAANRTVLKDSYFQKSHLHDFSEFNLILLLGKAGFRVNFATVPDPQFPRDKNALIVCAKSDKGKRKFAPDTHKASALLEKLKIKIGAPYINLGRPMRVVHIGSQHINIGDGAISVGIRSGITNIAQSEVEFHSLDIVDYANYGETFTAEMINSYNPDLVVVGGGGTIDGHENRVYTGTAFTIPLEEIEKLSAPISFVGLGHNLFPGQEFHCAEELSTFIEFCRDREIPFSVRRDGSWERLHDVIDDDLMSYIDIIPDPGFFISASRKVTPYVSPLAERNIIIQLAPDAYMHRYGSRDEMMEFIDLIAKYLVWAIRKYHIHVTLATHTLDDSWGIMALLNQDIPNTMRRLYTRTTGVYHPVYAQEFFSTYANADLVVGMRGHSVICGTGLGIPTIALSSHAKVYGYMKEADALDWTFPVKSKNLLAELQVATEDLAENSVVQLDKISNATKTWGDDYYVFLSKVMERIV